MKGKATNIERGDSQENIQFIMDGKLFSLNNLDSSMNQAFVNFYSAQLGTHPYNRADFEQSSLEFFDRVSSDTSSQDKYFTNFTIIWRHLLDGGRLNEAESLWELAVQPAIAWEEKHQGKFIHKGTPFYFWGATSLDKGDIDRGFALIHQALEEDIRTTGNPSPDLPAFLFATLNYDNPKQYLRGRVQEYAEFLSEIITSYNCSRSRKFSLDDFRNRFLSKLPNWDTVFLFVYSLARIRNIELVPTYALSSKFAAQLEMNLLFDIALVIDAAIKPKNSAKWKFIDHAEFLSGKTMLGLCKAKLIEINEQFDNAFEKTLLGVLDRSFQFRDNSKLVIPEACDLAITYGLRNHAAHNISSASIIWERFKDVRQSLFNTLFLTVETLY